MTHVLWHDIECGRYAADLPLWRALAEAEAGPVLDIGAGTGRVTLDLARRGHRVVALDREPLFLEALRERAGALPVETVVADASGYDLGERRFGLIIAPMQTIQLLGADGRMGFLRSARRHLLPGGLLACALAGEMDPFEADDVLLPLPDEGAAGGMRYLSQPVALRDAGDRMAIHRVRQVIDGSGRERSSDDVIHLDKVSPAHVEIDGLAVGLRAQEVRVIPATEIHVGTIVVMLRG